MTPPSLRSAPRRCPGFRLLGLAIAPCALLALGNDAHAATLYVDGRLPASGCATYDPGTRACGGGGSATAYSSVVATFPVVVAGDTVIIREGTYAEPDRQIPASSGSAGAPITFRAFPGENVRIQGPLVPRNEPSTTASPFDLSGRAFIDLEGFEITGYGLCVRLDQSSDISIRRMNIHDCGQGIWITHASARVSISDLVSSHNSFRDGGASVNIQGATDIRVERATAMLNSGDPAVGAVEGDGFHADDLGNARITFVDCVATDNEDDGFDLTGTDVRVERSIAARNIVGFKLWDEHCDPSTCPPSPDMNRFTLIQVTSWNNGETGLFAQNGPDLEIYNSVFAGNTYEGIRLVQNRDTLPDPVASAVMQNDLIVSNGSWGRRFDAAGADNTDWALTSDHNVFYANGNGNAVWSGEDPSTLQSDPRFVAESAGDFHLRAGSPAIDTGRDLSALFTTDADGAMRPVGAGWDRGLYEFGAMTTSDAGTMDAMMVRDAGSDASARMDSGMVRDGAGSDDAPATDGHAVDGSVDAGHAERPGGCGCRVPGSSPRGGSDGRVLALAGMAMTVMLRRARRR